MTFENKVYAKNNLKTGVANCLNDVMVDGDIQVRSGSVINKLLFSGSSIVIDDRCTLDGYTRAQNKIHFLGSATFKYLYAPLLEFGHVSTIPPNKAVDIFLENMPRMIREDKLVIPEHSLFENHIVAKDTLVIKNNCIIKGNIKCYHDIVIENNTTIIGAVFSEKDITISSGCFIQGPIVAKGTIRIEEHCMIGARDDMTSLIAQTVIISGSCRVSGLVLAKLNGSFK